MLINGIYIVYKEKGEKMNINVYGMRMNEDKTSYLIKEAAYEYEGSGSVTDAEDIVTMLNAVFDLKSRAEEHLFMIALSTTQEIKGVFEISHGDIFRSPISSREIFSRALLIWACAIILAHNHTSGHNEPSQADIDRTKKILIAGEIMGIQLLDHIIIGDEYTSMLNLGMLRLSA